MLRRPHPFLLAPALVAALLAALSLGGARLAHAAAGTCSAPASWGTTDRSLAVEVTELVNRHRAAIGLRPLVVSPTLTRSASWKSLHMARYGYMDHGDPGPPFTRTAPQRAADCGYPIGRVSWGENIAAGPSSAQAVMSVWLTSPAHRANIEKASFRAIGVAAAQDADGNYFWTQNFGSLADSGSASPAAASAERSSSAVKSAAPRRP